MSTMDERATTSDDGDGAAMAGICGPPGGQQELAALYSRVAPIYAEQGPPFFEHAGRRLVELAQVRPGDVVLDVATGRDAVLIPAARRAGRTGQVAGSELGQACP